ncbi:MAG: ATP-binding protein [Proteobacteria bacterium]|nr:ATP-binding protein [Pseudomonadota bacterium]
MGLRLLLFIVLSMAALIPVVFFGVWPHSRAFDKELSDVTDRHLLLARNMGAALQRYDRDVKSTFRSLTLNLVRDTPLTATKEILSNLNFRHICVARIGDGTVVHSLYEEGAPCPERVPAKRLAIFKEIASKDEVKFTEVLPGPHGGPLIYVVLIVGDYLSVGAITTDYIVELAKAISFGTRGHAAIVDHKGKVLAHPLPMWRQTMKDISAVEPVKRMLNMETGVATFYSPALKDDMIAGFAWVPGPNWGVMIPQPLSELRARADAVQRYALGVIAAGVLAAAILSWFLSGYLTRPVLAVVNTAREMAGGVRSVRVPAINKAAPRELKALRETFNAMANANDAAHQKLTAVAEAVSSATGENAFEQLVRSLAQILQVDYVFIGELAAASGNQIRTIAFCRDGVVADNFDYNLIGAPCENVFGKKTCIYRRDVQLEFPRDKKLIMLEVQSYIGMPLFDPDGTHLGLIVMMHREPLDDFGTAMDLLHILANRAAAELHRRNLENRLIQAQKMEAVGQLTGGIAHDFNNLLAVIIGNLDIINEDLEGNAELRPLLENATKAALSGANLNAQLLAFSRKQPLSPKVIDLTETVSGMLEMLQRTLGATVEIETKQHPGRCTTEVDPAQLESALLNLAVNARDAMPGGGKLIIETMKVRLDDEDVSTRPEMTAGEFVRLAVSDTGMGMSQEVLSHVFEPFFTTKDVGKGSGLGLSMVFGFTKQSGGHVEIESELDVGTTVRLYLPYTSLAPTVAPEKSATMPKGRGETVLVVEDDPDIRRLAVRLLVSLDYTVLEAWNGKSALAELESVTDIDLLLTDMVMPGGISGPDLAKEAVARLPNIKVLYMSGYTSDSMLPVDDLADDTEVLRKPFRKFDLANMVRAALDT